MEFLQKILRVEMPPDLYLSKLSDQDQKNVRDIISGLGEGNNKVGGWLVAVGSSVRKKEGWNDIDLRVFADRGCSIPDIISRFREVVEILGFEIKEGRVLTDGSESRSCFYLSRGGGKIVHAILPVPELDASAEDELFYNQVTRKPFSVLCRF